MLDKKAGNDPGVPDVTDYRKERRNAVLTVAVLAAWIIFVLAVVSRSTSVALTSDSLSMEYVAPLLFVILLSVVFLVIFCLPSTLKGEEDSVQGPVVVDNDGYLNLRSSADVT